VESWSRGVVESWSRGVVSWDRLMSRIVEAYSGSCRYSAHTSKLSMTTSTKIMQYIMYNSKLLTASKIDFVYFKNITYIMYLSTFFLHNDDIFLLIKI
jgi:hypothetical protein